uniref:Neprosin PEP catalytic domain-containing protein n=1 Tax=Ananas comosus var. bracteatus TaxID=296719 RepID=A0A6V7NJI1_ANACO|nr:unnamed protein product [Ananas comosus var. bracteatus]
MRRLLKEYLTNLYLQFGGSLKEVDSDAKHHSNESESSNRSVHLREEPIAPDPPDYIRHWAYYYAKPGKYYGTRAKINLWGHPNLKYYQRSTTTMWVMNFNGKANVIEAGFHVYPRLYNDSKLHFFTYWTADGGISTGCYNFHCKGFAMVDWNVLTPGDVIDTVSTYNGQQYYITLSIKKDWLLYREDLITPKLIGYWPKSLFTTLANSATHIEWGGHVGYAQRETGPPMGSGFYATELGQKAAYIKNIELFDSDGRSFELIDGAQYARTDVEECYNLTPLINSGKYGLHDGFLFYFGGPAGCTK